MAVFKLKPLTFKGASMGIAVERALSFEHDQMFSLSIAGLLPDQEVSVEFTEILSPLIPSDRLPEPWLADENRVRKLEWQSAFRKSLCSPSE